MGLKQVDFIRKWWGWNRCSSLRRHALLFLAILQLAFFAMETPSSVQISSLNETERTVPEPALINEPGQTSGAAAV